MDRKDFVILGTFLAFVFAVVMAHFANIRLSAQKEKMEELTVELTYARERTRSLEEIRERLFEYEECLQDGKRPRMAGRASISGPTVYVECK